MVLTITRDSAGPAHRRLGAIEPDPALFGQRNVTAAQMICDRLRLAAPIASPAMPDLVKLSWTHEDLC
jgi:hypothetical protein